MMKFVTILMPAYNSSEPEFRQAIESILNQTFKDFEFLIINDGSTNNVESVVLSYKDPRIHYKKNPSNLGIIKTLNRGLELAQGKYIARLDSDDYSYPTRLEKQFEFMEKNPDIAVLGTFVEGRLNTPIKPEDVTLIQRYVCGLITHSSVMIRKSVLDEHNLKYDKNCLHAEDFKLWSDISQYSKLAIYPEVLTYYRFSKDGISRSNAAWQNKMVCLIMLYNMIRDFPCNKNYMSVVLNKFMTSTPLSSIEYRVTKNFLKNIVNAIKLEVSEPFKDEVEIFIMAVLSLFVRE